MTDVDYDELVDRIILDCGLSGICDDVSKLSDELMENRSITKQQFKSMIQLINRMDDRLDTHMEAQATRPMREVDELRKWLKEYIETYMRSSADRMESNETQQDKNTKEIFGNGKKGLRTEIESLKTKATITLWLVGILLTGTGLSAIVLVIWQTIYGG